MNDLRLATAGRHLEEMAQIGLQMEEDGVSGEHMKAMWAGQSNVLVAVRVRPLMKHDVIKKSCVRVLDSKVVVIMDPASGDKQDILRANRSREKQYAFDYVFEPGSSQESTYHHTTKFLIHGVLDGYNATVFAYGQTGSGKTHTMIGNPQDPGIMVRVMSDLFVHSATQGKQQGVHYKVSVSFLEVYNENIRDLLSDTEEYLDLREDPIKGPVVASITEIEASSGQEIMQLLIQGNAKRSQAATAANEVSSRSHAVLQVVVESRDRAPGTVANIKVGKLSLVDLAGSERAANTKNVGQRLVEGANINRSLLALGNCINALGEKGNKGNFVPYRDSKLTRLLKDSLGGNCRTVMIANISAAESSFEETLNTLKYANRAKNIKTNVQRNVLNVNYHISEYVQLINNLRSEIQILKGQISQPGQELEGVGSSPAAGGHPTPSRHAPSTPFHVLRESMRAATASVNGGEGRELVNNMRQRIVENFQERMQLRRSLIELEDQNVQNSIEVSKRQLIVVQWSEAHGNINKKNKNGEMPSMTKADFAADILANGDPEIQEAWQECEQLRKAIMKNNGMKKNIAKRLRHNEREAEKFRDELGDKITGEDRRELMELQYQVGRLELENMELEQHRIVHESILKGKDLVIQKLKLQLAVRDKLIARQQAVLVEHDLDNKVGYSQLAVMEQTLMGDYELNSVMAPPSPPRNMSDMMLPNDLMLHSVDSIAMSSVSATGGLSSVVGGGPGGVGSGQKHSHHHKAHFEGNRGGGGAHVPPLRMLPASEHSTIDIDGDNEEELYIDDGYEVVPVTERGEVALSSRDRDFIEQGDWSEINNELHDRDTSFVLGKSPSSDFKRGGYQPDSEEKHSKNNKNDVNNTPSSVIARNTNNTNSNGSLNGGAAAGGGSSNSKVVGPRGGRHFRSAVEDVAQVPAVPQQQQPQGKPKPKVLSQPSDNFQIEDSDNESTNSTSKNNYGSNKHNSGNKKGITPRRGMGGVSSADKLEPIPLPSAVEEGVLTGRKYEAGGGGGGRGGGAGGRYSNNSDRERDITPRRGNNNGGPNYDSGHEAAAAPPVYAPVYPSLFNKDKNSNNNAAGGAKVGVAAAAPSGNKEPPGYRRNSKGLLEPLEFPADQFSDLNIGGKGVLNKQPSVKNVALGKAKKGGVADGFNPAAGVAAAPLSVREGAAMAAAENNSMNSNLLNLNVNGSGFDSNGQPGLAPLNSVRPANKMKPTRPSRKVTASDGGGGAIAENIVLSVDGVGSDALAVELGYRNKSLPNLPKQMGAPNSARDK